MADFRTGQICAALYNSKRTKRSDPMVGPEDFFPSLRDSGQPEESEPVSDEAVINAMAKSLGAELVIVDG